MGEQALAEEKLSLWRANVAAAKQMEAAAQQRKLEREAAEKEYEVKVDAWQEECRGWAERETARLWRPWHVWKVRYVAYDALFAGAAAEEAAPIETIYTLDEPSDIVGSMHPVAPVDMVDYFGKVTPGFTLATFLDGVRVDYTAPRLDGGLLHHRSYHAGGYTVNVPAFVLEEPAPAPAMPARTN